MTANKSFFDIGRLLSQGFIPGEDYYRIRLLIPDTNTNSVQWAYCSRWAGFVSTKKNKPRREKREIAPVNPDATKAVLTQLGEPPIVVNDQIDLIAYIILGGNAIIRKCICETNLPELCRVNESHFSYTDPGYAGTQSKPRDAVFKRKAEEPLRTEVFARDGFACKKCGASPKFNPNVQLQIHHINPWSQGGLTEPDNLITLCHDCHEPIGNELDLAFYQLIGLEPYGISDDRLSEYQQGVLRYHEMVKQYIAEEAKLIGLDIRTSDEDPRRMERD